MFKVGDKVDYMYPTKRNIAMEGEVLHYYPTSKLYEVKLFCSGGVSFTTDETSLTKRRDDRFNGKFEGGEYVQVTSIIGNGRIWSDAVVQKPVFIRDDTILVAYDTPYERVCLTWVKMSDIRLKNLPQEQPKEVICSECEEPIPNNKSFFYEFKTCAWCFVETKVDSLLDELDDFEPEEENMTRFEQLRKYILGKRLFILQTGGSSKVKDERLFKQLKRGLEQLKELLPEEHEDEEEWSPSSSSDSFGDEDEEEEEEFISQKKQKV